MTVWTDNPNDSLNGKNNAHYKIDDLNDLNINQLMCMILQGKGTSD